MGVTKEDIIKSIEENISIIIQLQGPSAGRKVNLRDLSNHLDSFILQSSIRDVRYHN